MRFFKVTARRGHCGNGRYIPIVFAFAAKDITDAVDRAKRMPGVKHRQFILSAQEISRSEYVSLRKVSAYERLERMDDYE